MKRMCFIKHEQQPRTQNSIGQTFVLWCAFLLLLPHLCFRALLKASKNIIMRVEKRREIEKERKKALKSTKKILLLDKQFIISSSIFLSNFHFHARTFFDLLPMFVNKKIIITKSFLAIVYV